MAAIAVAAPGCGFGSGEGSAGSAELVVTRDHGADRLLAAKVENPSESETVARFLDGEAEIETSYGGNFVDSIEGIEGNGRSDWFFYVNGYWSPLGAAETEVEAGDRIWWDYRDWQGAYRVPVVVGSWPAPFAGEEGPVELDCEAAALCNQVEGRLTDVGADLSGPESEGIRVVVGLWRQIAEDRDVAPLTQGPAASGVYAEGRELTPLGEDGDPAPASPEIEGLVAAVRHGQRPPTWIVTGTDRAGLETAAASLSRRWLVDRYALAIAPGGERFGLPVVER